MEAQLHIYSGLLFANVTVTFFSTMNDVHEISQTLYKALASEVMMDKKSALQSNNESV
jgi:hypothetical protein